MRTGKLSVLLCMLAPALGVTTARLVPSGEHDFYGVGPICAGLVVFAALTLAGGGVGVVALSRGSRAGVYALAWSAFCLVALALWAASFAFRI